MNDRSIAIFNICCFGNYPLRELSSSQLFMCFSIVSYLFQFSSRLIFGLLLVLSFRCTSLRDSYCWAWLPGNSSKFDAKFDECLGGLLLFYAIQNVNLPEPPGPGTMPLSRQEVAVSNRARGASNDARAAADDYNVALDVALGSGRGGAR